jgi:hypothetical protein
VPRVRKWTDEWSCTCNDRCPKCRAEIEPYDDVDLTYIVAPGAKGMFTVLFTPDTIEIVPRYEAIGILERTETLHSRRGLFLASAERGN